MTTRPRRTALALGLGLAILLAACSGAATVPTLVTGSDPSGAVAASLGTSAASGTPEPTSGAVGDSDPDGSCSMVSKADVAIAVGYAIATANGAGGTCIYQNTDPSMYFAVQRFADRGAMGLYLNIEDSAQHVDGLGDDAFYNPVAGFLFVRKGDKALLFLNQAWVMTDPTDTAHRDALVTLARTALPNL